MRLTVQRLLASESIGTVNGKTDGINVHRIILYVKAA